jgi:Cu/Zn superoxide dismutase
LTNINRHSGDLGNITLNKNGNGNGYLYVTSNLTMLSGVNSILGRSVILHQTFDDGITQPAG